MADAAAPNAAFAAFVREHSRTLFGTAYLLTGDSHAAEELLQDTLARLYGRWASVAAATSPLAYVRRSVANRFISQSRGPSRRVRVVAEVPERGSGQDVAVDVTDRALLWQLLQELPERQRAAIVLRYYHDLPESEIAASLGCREATVRSLVSRGLAAMRDASLVANSTGGDRR